MNTTEQIIAEFTAAQPARRREIVKANPALQDALMAVVDAEIRAEAKAARDAEFRAARIAFLSKSPAERIARARQLAANNGCGYDENSPALRAEYAREDAEAAAYGIEGYVSHLAPAPIEPVCGTSTDNAMFQCPAHVPAPIAKVEGDTQVMQWEYLARTGQNEIDHLRRLYIWLESKQEKLAAIDDKTSTAAIKAQMWITAIEGKIADAESSILRHFDDAVEAAILADYPADTDPAPAQADIATRLETRAADSAQDDDDPMPAADVILMLDAADEIRRLQTVITDLQADLHECERARRATDEAFAGHVQAAVAEVEALKSDKLSVTNELLALQSKIAPRGFVTPVADPVTGNIREYRYSLKVIEFVENRSGYAKTHKDALAEVEKLMRLRDTLADL